MVLSRSIGHHCGALTKQPRCMFTHSLSSTADVRCEARHTGRDVTARTPLPLIDVSSISRLTAFFLFHVLVCLHQAPQPATSHQPPCSLVHPTAAVHLQRTAARECEPCPVLYHTHAWGAGRSLLLLFAQTAAVQGCSNVTADRRSCVR